MIDRYQIAPIGCYTEDYKVKHGEWVKYTDHEKAIAGMILDNRITEEDLVEHIYDYVIGDPEGLTIKSILTMAKSKGWVK